MTQIVYKHLRDTKNIGDLSCSPYDYIPYEGAEVADYRTDGPEADVIIYGGGQIFGGLRRNAGPIDRRAALKIGWGIGTNRSTPFSIRKLIDTRFLDLIGTRDYGVDAFAYAPCASCMSDLFDRDYEVEHDVVFYGHAQRSIGVNLARDPSIPWLTNESDSLATAIAFLGSAETVVSNSYHGVYWSLLLGKKVLCVPFSDKFRHYRLPPGYSTPENWPQELAKAQRQDEMLSLSRAATLDFDKKVRARIQDSFGQD